MRSQALASAGGAPPADRAPRGLVYHAGALGDFVLSLPAVFRVVQARQDLSWELWGPAERVALLPGFGPAPPALRRSGHTLWGTAPAGEALTALRRYRLVLAFGGREPPSWAVPPGPHVLRVASFPPPGGDWVPAHQGRQLRAQGVAPPPRPWLASWGREVLPRKEPSGLVLHPGSGDLRKNLPLRTWERVLAILRDRTGLPATLLLGPAEEERGGWEPLARAAGAVRVCNGLPALLAALSRAALFLGNDSGPSHLAAALGIPTAVVFGPSDPRLWRPLGPRVRVVQTPQTCAPCSAGEPIRCGLGSCLDAVGAGLVADAAADLWARTTAAGGPGPFDGAGPTA